MASFSCVVLCVLVFLYSNKRKRVVNAHCALCAFNEYTYNFPLEKCIFSVFTCEYISINRGSLLMLNFFLFLKEEQLIDGSRSARARALDARVRALYQPSIHMRIHYLGDFRNVKSETFGFTLSILDILYGN